MKEKIESITTLIAQISLPILAFIVPVFFLPITPDQFSYNKKFLILVVATILLINWVVKLLFRRRVTIAVGPATYPVLLLALTYLLSTFIQSSTPYLSIMGKTSLMIALSLIFLITTSLNEKNNSLFTFLALAISSIVLSITSILSYLKINIPFVPGNLLGDPVSLLAFSIPLLPVFFYLGITNKSFFSKIVFLVSSALSLSSIATQVSILFIQKTQTPIVLPIQAGWAIAIDIFKSGRAAFLGVGPENFISAFTRLRPVAMNSDANLWTLRFGVSSNELFDTLTTVGLLGALFLSLIFYKSLKTVLKEKLLDSSLIKALFMGLFLLGISFLVVPASVASLALLFILLSLLTIELKASNSDSTYILSLSLFAIKVITNKLEQKREESIDSGQSVFMWIFSLLLISPVVYFWLYAGRAYAASIITSIAAKNLSSNTKLSYEKQIEAYNLEPLNPIYRINFAQTSLALANSLATKQNLTETERTTITQLVQQSIREAKNAASLAPNNISTWENLAVIYKQLLNFADGSVDWAIATYNQSIALDPSNPTLRLDLGGVFFARGDYENAIRLYGQAVDLKPDWANAHYNLASAYKGKKDYARAFSSMEQVLKLLKSDSADYSRAQAEYDELKSMAPKAGTNTSETPKTDNIELVTPTPINKASKNKITLPKDSAPVIPSPTGEPTATSSATPQ